LILAVAVGVAISAAGRLMVPGALPGPWWRPPWARVRARPSTVVLRLFLPRC